MYQYILFDLDGTLTDPGLGITNSIMYALKKFGIEENDRASLYRFIGPPLLDSFQRFYGFTEEQSEQATAYYREYFSDRGLYENAVYDGVETMLKTLQEQGKTLILATSKPEVFAVEILRYFKLEQYFTLIAGATMDASRNKKSDVIAYAIEKSGITDRSSAVMKPAFPAVVVTTPICWNTLADARNAPQQTPPARLWRFRFARSGAERRFASRRPVSSATVTPEAQDKIRPMASYFSASRSASAPSPRPHQMAQASAPCTPPAKWPLSGSRQVRMMACSVSSRRAYSAGISSVFPRIPAIFSSICSVFTR